MIRLATEADIDEILPILRAQESKTIERLRLDPAALLRSRLGPFAFTGEAEGRVACMYGIWFWLTEHPRLWMLTTPLVEHHRIEFLRGSREFVRWARAEFGPIDGCVDSANVISRKWLEWLGFRAIDTDGVYLRMRHGD